MKWNIKLLIFFAFDSMLKIRRSLLTIFRNETLKMVMLLGNTDGNDAFLHLFHLRGLETFFMSKSNMSKIIP